MGEILKTTLPSLCSCVEEWHFVLYKCPCLNKHRHKSGWKRKVGQHKQQRLLDGDEGGGAESSFQFFHYFHLSSTPPFM